MKSCVWRVAMAACVMGSGLIGCQSYEPAPLDLQAHSVAFATRPTLLGDAQGFAARIAAMGAEAPERFDASDGLSLAEGELVALVFNRELRLARLRAGVTLARYENAGLWEDPVFGFNGAELLNPSGPFEFDLGLELTIPISGRLGIERKLAGAEHEAELLSIVDAEWSLRCSVRGLWSAWTLAEERAKLLRSAVDEIDTLAATSAKLEGLGELSRTDHRMVRLESLQRRIGLREAEVEAARAKSELLAAMGLPADAAITLIPGLPGLRSLPGVDAESLRERLIASNTALAVHRARYAAAEQSLRLEVRKQFPDITIGGGYGSEGNDDRLLMGVSIPLPILNANRGAIATARAERELARADAEAELERLSGLLAQGIADLAAIAGQRTLHEGEVLPLVDEQIEELDRLSKLGEWNTLVIIDAVTRQMEARTRLLDLKLSELEAALLIDELLGPSGDGKSQSAADEGAM